jgi:hypothetical protein
MKKQSFSPLIFALGVIWLAGASSAATKSSGGSMSGSAGRGSSATTSATGGIAKGKLRAFTTPAELKANKTILVTNGGGGPPSTGGPGGSGQTRSGLSASASGGNNFGFGRPLTKPVIKVKAKARPKE